MPSGGGGTDTDLVLQITLLEAQHDDDEQSGVEQHGDDPTTQRQVAMLQVVLDHVFKFGHVVHHTHCSGVAKHNKHGRDKDHPVERSEVRDLLLHRFLVANVEQLVKQSELRNREGYRPYLDQDNKTQGRIVTQVDNIDEGKEDRKARDDSSKNRRLLLLLFYRVKPNTETDQEY